MDCKRLQILKNKLSKIQTKHYGSEACINLANIRKLDFMYDKGLVMKLLINLSWGLLYFIKNNR